MRWNDMGMVLITLGVGFLLGVLSTLAIYSMIMNRKMENERERFRAALEQVQEERDLAQERIQLIQEYDARTRAAIEQGVEPPLSPSPRGEPAKPVEEKPREPVP